MGFERFVRLTIFRIIFDHAILSYHALFGNTVTLCQNAVCRAHRWWKSKPPEAWC